jgi:hypothetical protein
MTAKGGVVGNDGLIPLRSIAPLLSYIAPLLSYIAFFNGFNAHECHGRGAMQRSGISPGGPVRIKQG